jgi:hypothetical protein
MSLQSWLQNSWLVPHTTSPEEIKNLLAISDRDLLTCQVKQLPADWRCTIAHNAALQAATAALAAAGYRAARDNHHYRVIQSLEFTCGTGQKIHRRPRWFSQEAQREQLGCSWGHFGQRSGRDAQTLD